MLLVWHSFNIALMHSALPCGCFEGMATDTFVNGCPRLSVCYVSAFHVLYPTHRHRETFRRAKWCHPATFVYDNLHDSSHEPRYCTSGRDQFAQRRAARLLRNFEPCIEAQDQKRINSIDHQIAVNVAPVDTGRRREQTSIETQNV